jgi:hypothetical protein
MDRTLRAGFMKRSINLYTDSPLARIGLDPGISEIPLFGPFALSKSSTLSTRFSATGD